MFRGSASAKIDDKSRLKIPTDFRRILEERYGAELFVTSVSGESALIYPLPVWEEIEARLSAAPSSDQAKQRYLERVNYFGQQTGVDAQGRISIPPTLRESAEIHGEVMVLGKINHLEVWNSERIGLRLKEQPFTDADFHALTERGI